MRIFIYAVVLLVFTASAVLLVVSDAIAAERSKIFDSRNRQVGDIYCPGHGRRCQIRDNDRRIKFYIEKDGTITDTRRRKVKEIELPQQM